MAARPRRPIVTFITDFGTKDQYVGVMKGVILSIAPSAAIVDLTHEVQVHEPAAARFLLAQSWPYFPKGSVHVAVVDPGVGSARRPILVEAQGHVFVGPDNGVLSDLIARPKAKTRHITNSRLCRSTISQTFHGRDIFAPVAAHLARGVPAARAGPLIDDAFRAASDAPIRTGRRTWIGSVVHVDRFGNLITNFAAADFPDITARRFELSVGLVKLIELQPSYAAGPAGQPLLIIGSSGNLEVAVNQDSAAARLGCATGSPVDLEMF
jgi:S-adenosyl-L-methionine hydrolase (adenosine-forming)